jgi:hypothetical protein
MGTRLQASVLRSAALVLALAGYDASAAAPVAGSTPDHCIVGTNAIGCVDPLAIDKLTAGVDDPVALRQQLEQQLGAGTCTLFEYGERVYVVATDRSGHASVRRPDDTATYWMPSSWPRPAEECRRNASQATLDHKTGVQTVRSNLFQAPHPASRELVRDAPKQAPSPCVIKPVMTDADIAACRNAAH